MTRRSAWNEEEDEALQGLPIEAQILYLRGLRQYMNYQTGFVGGYQRRISWRSLRETLQVDPHQGLGGGMPDRAKVRRLIQWLEKAGLVVRVEAAGYLAFRLPLALVDSFAPKKADPIPTPPTEGKADPPETTQSNEIKEQVAAPPEKADPIPTPPTEEKADPHPVSGNTNYTTPPRAHARSNPRADDVPETPQAWQQLFVNELGYDFRQAMTAKAAAMYRRWTDAGVTAQDVRDAAAVAASQGKDRPAPTYFADMAMEIHEEKQKSPGAQGSAGGASSQITSVGGTQHGPRHPRNQPRSAIDRVLANAQAAWEAGEFE